MNRATAMQELLPWLVPVSEGLVACKDSGLLACFEFSGVDGDSVGQSELVQVADAGNRLMMALRDLPVVVWWTMRRERAVNYPGERMPDPVSKMIDDEHRAQFEASSGFVNRHFFSLIWLPERNTASMFGKIGQQMADGVSMFAAVKFAIQSTFFGRAAFAWRIAELEQVIEKIEGRLTQLQSIMSSVSLRRLQTTELLGFLWAMVNPGYVMCQKNWNEETFFDALLPERPLEVKRTVLQFGDEGAAHYVSATSLKSWPDAFQFSALAGLTTLPVEMVVSHAFQVMTTEAAEKHMHKVKAANDILKYPVTTLVFGALLKKGAMNESKADPHRAEKSVAAMQAKGQLNKGDVLFGNHNCTVLVVDKDFDRVEHYTDEMQRLLNGGGFVGVVRESMHLLSAWATTLPGQYHECRRWITLSSKNITYLAPLVGVSSGERYNPYLTRELQKPIQALTVFRSDHNTPYYFNFHAGDLGHTAIIGPPRMGKSIGCNFLMSQARKYGDSIRVLTFDKDHSCRIPILLQGGEYIDLRSGGDVKLNPFHMISDKSTWGFLLDWTEHRIAARGFQVNATHRKAIAQAIKETAARGSEFHRLQTIATFLPMELREQLAEWVADGPYAEFMDNVEDSFSYSNFIGIEMGEVMKQSHLATAFMEYAFFRIKRMLEEQRHKGDMRATMIYIEECWFMFENPRFWPLLKDWLKTLGKLYGFLVLTTQSVEDFLSLPLEAFAAFRDATLTKIFLPNPAARSEDLAKFYKTRLNLRPDTIEAIASAVPRQDYIITKPDLVRKVRLDLTARQVAALRSETSAQRAFNEIYAKREPGWQFQYIDKMTGGAR